MNTQIFRPRSLVLAATTLCTALATGNPGTVTQVVKVGPACPGHGIDIDPVSNIAGVGCFGGTGDTGDIVVNLSTGKSAMTLTDIGGTDAVVFNPNNRRFYYAAGLNAATTSGCPKVTAPFVPIVGIVSQTGGAWCPTSLAAASVTLWESIRLQISFMCQPLNIRQIRTAI